MENLRVRRAGFAYRRKYDTFLDRYKSLCPKTWPHYDGPAEKGVEVLMKHLGYDEDDYQLGKYVIMSEILWKKYILSICHSNYL